MTASQNVAVPTVTVTTVRSLVCDHQTTGVYLQWFGDSSSAELPPDSQFFFPLSTTADNPTWGGMLETFRVAFLGQIRDWPNPDAAQTLADSLGHEDLEGWVLYLVSGELVTFHPPDPGHMGPTCLALPLSVMLACPSCGIITPQPYNDPGVVKQETDKANPLIKCPGCELRLREDDESGQYVHMTEEHPDILLQREQDGCPIDTAFWFRDLD